MEDYMLIYDWMPIIRVSDEKYPMYMPEVRASTTQTSFPIPIRDYILEPFGFMPVYSSDIPSGDVVTEGKPELKEDGKWYMTWDVRDFTPEEKAANLAKEKDYLISQGLSLLNYDLSTGISYVYAGKTYSVDVMQEKLTILLCIKSLAKDAPEDTNYQYSFMDGTLLSFTREEFLTMWNSVMSSVYELNKTYWAFREVVKQAVDVESLPALPATFKPEE